MNRIFLATGFSGHTNYETGEIYPGYRSHMETILSSLREVGGFSVFCAMEQEGWRISKEPASTGMAIDLEELKASDGLLYIPNSSHVSEGASIEVGIALGTGVRVVVGTDKGQKPGYAVQGLIDLGLISHVPFESPEELATELVAVLSSKIKD